MATNPNTTTVTVDKSVYADFQNKCQNNNKTVKSVVEEFMKYYSDDFEIVVTKKIK